jgi:hypothetical protein
MLADALKNFHETAYNPTTTLPRGRITGTFSRSDSVVFGSYHALKDSDEKMLRRSGKDARSLWFERVAEDSMALRVEMKDEVMGFVSKDCYLGYLRIGANCIERSRPWRGRHGFPGPLPDTQLFCRYRTSEYISEHRARSGATANFRSLSLSDSEAVPSSDNRRLGRTVKK